MSTVELRNEFHALIDSITDATVLERFLTIMKAENGKAGVLWKELNTAQQDELLLSDEESKTPDNLISHEEMKKRHSKWL